eukprot:940559_1
MENVIMYCSKLNKIKKILKKESMRSHQMVDDKKKERRELYAKYKTLRIKRMKIHGQWINALQELNKTIDDENATNDAKCCAESQYNTSKLEAEQWNMLRTKCVQLLKKYQVFDAHNEQNIQNMRRMFYVLWNNSMKQWFEWQPKDIICWIKYLKLQKQLTLSDAFDFDHVLNEMIKSKMNGLSLKTIDKSDLKTVGVMTLDDRR